MTRILTLAALLILLQCQLRAQTLEAGILGGVSMYSGDLTPDGVGLYLQESHPAVGFFSRMNFSDKFGARFSVNFAKVSGDDNNTPNAGASKSSRNNELQKKLVRCGVKSNLLHI